MNDVVGRDAVGGDHQQPAVGPVHLPDLAAGDELEAVEGGVGQGHGIEANTARGRIGVPRAGAGQKQREHLAEQALRHRSGVHHALEGEAVGERVDGGGELLGRQRGAQPELARGLVDQARGGRAGFGVGGGEAGAAPRGRARRRPRTP